ncbi:MAG: hypothetical protein IJZ16_01555 [Clostridia bacterium]|nr:hypothetical protein [Clostridia bacterium]
MKNKTRIIFLMILLLITIFSSCIADNSKEDILLCDYKNIQIEKEYTLLSEADIETIISLDLSSEDCYKEIENRNYLMNEDIVLLSLDSDNITYCIEDYYYEIGVAEISEEFDNFLIGKDINNSYNFHIDVEEEKIEILVNIKGIYRMAEIKDEEFICAFYECENMEQVKDFIINRAYKGIVFNYMWEQILINSKINSFPEHIEAEIETRMNSLVEEAQEGDMSVEEYLKESGFTLDEYKQSLYDYYYEILIAETILEKENEPPISDEEINKKIKKISEENEITIEEVAKYFTTEDIYYQVLIEKMKEILVPLAVVLD